MNFWNRKPQKTTYQDLSDVELVQLAKEDKEAFGEIYNRYLDKIYKYCYYRVGSAKDAEDLTSKVFYRALAHVDRYEDRGVPFQAWLYRIAHNLVANHHRDKGRRKIIPLDEYIVNNVYTGTSTGPETSAEQMEERAHLLTVIRGLPEDRQQLLILKFVDRLSNAEIGEIMGRTEGAVKSLYHRTLTSLRETLSNADDLLAQAERKAK